MTHSYVTFLEFSKQLLQKVIFISCGSDIYLLYISASLRSVHFNHSVVSNCLQPHGLQHIRLPYPSTIPELAQIYVHPVVMPSNHLILCCSLLLLPSIFTSIRVFSSESALQISWPKYWSLNFSISPSSEHSGLISFRMNWLDLLAVQETLKSLLQHHSSKCQFFGAQLSLQSNSHIHT